MEEVHGEEDHPHFALHPPPGRTYHCPECKGQIEFVGICPQRDGIGQIVPCDHEINMEEFTVKILEESHGDPPG